MLPPPHPRVHLSSERNQGWDRGRPQHSSAEGSDRCVFLTHRGNFQASSDILGSHRNSGSMATRQGVTCSGPSETPAPACDFFFSGNPRAACTGGRTAVLAPRLRPGGLRLAFTKPVPSWGWAWTMDVFEAVCVILTHTAGLFLK